MKPKQDNQGRQNLFSGHVVKLDLDTVTLPNGKEATREIVTLSQAVCLLALDDRENALVVEQFRYPYRQVLLELPAGKVDPGEAPEETAVRELMEETGYRPGKLTPLGTMYPTPGSVHEILHLFVATELVPDRADPDDDEFIEAYFLPLDELAARIGRGEVPDAKTQIAVLRYLQMKGRL